MDVPLSFIKVLLPNTTLKLQLLDQVIIRTFKSVYKRRLIDTLLVKLHVVQDLKVDLFRCGSYVQSLTGQCKLVNHNKLFSEMLGSVPLVTKLLMKLQQSSVG